MSAMTEEEARKRWCPFARPTFPREDDCGYQAGNRDASGEVPGIAHGSTCIASECMAFRWAVPRLEETGRELPISAKPEDTPTSRWTVTTRMELGAPAVTVWVERRVIQRGYCGLSGPVTP